MPGINQINKVRIKTALQRLSLILNDEEEFIRMLAELEQELVKNIGPKGERDYSRFVIELRRVVVPYRDEPGVG